MSGELSVTELVRNFADYINRVVYRGERFVIETLSEIPWVSFAIETAVDPVAVMLRLQLPHDLRAGGA